MKGKKMVLWISVVVVLLLLNLWRWMPSRTSAKPAHRSVAAPGGLELQFPLGTAPAEKTPGRDIFTFGSIASPLGVHHAARKKTVQVSGPVPTPTEPYRLMGVVSDPGHSRALIGKGSQVFQVQEGDSLENSYTVGPIGDQDVDLTDQSTGKALTLRIQEPEPQEATP
jgi:hypothetical protein